MQRNVIRLSAPLKPAARTRVMALAQASLARPKHRVATLTVTGALFEGDTGAPRPYANVAGPNGARISCYF